MMGWNSGWQTNVQGRGETAAADGIRQFRWHRLPALRSGGTGSPAGVRLREM
jgi:hypothetical protein